MISEIAKTQLGQYLYHLEATGRKANTLKNVRSALNTVFNTLHSGGRSQDVFSFEPQTFHWLRENIPCKETTVKRLIRQLSRYCLYHTGRDIEKQADMLWNPVEVERKFITLEEFNRMLSVADPEMRSILLLGAMMGLRRSEIANARWEDVRNGKLIVFGKGHGKGLEAHLDIPPAVMDALVKARDSRADRAIVNPNDTHLVQGICNGVWKGLHPCSVSRSVSALGAECGVDLTAHSLRRLYAMTLHSLGVDNNTLKNLMRHADITTTYNCYLNADPVACNSAKKQFSEFMDGYVKYSV